MVSRTMDDYEAMVVAACAAVCEPAFWASFDRSIAHAFRDSFRQLMSMSRSAQPNLG
jgi:predicted metal-dependent TIM-barrel fold hydrolase